MTERRLSTTKRALLERLKRGSSSSSQGPPGIPRRADPKRAPLAFAQRRLWFVEQLESAGGAYVEPSLLRLAGPLDLSALQRALGAMVARHEALRTRFEVEDGEPQQVVAGVGEGMPPRLSLVDLGGCRDPQETGPRVAAATLGHPFDLVRGPLLRAVLYRLKQKEHLLLIAVHHIVLDGWSSQVLIREMTVAYEAFRSGGGLILPSVKVQFPDFAAWQRESLGGQRLEGLLSYWRQRLEDLPESLDLPLDRPRPARPTAAGSVVHLQLEKELTGNLLAQARARRGTLFMTLLAVFQALLARYSGQQDVCVGSPVAGRGHSDLDETVGCFINLLALRVRLEKRISWRGLLTEVRRAVLEAQEHDDLPFELLMEALTSPNRRRGPLFRHLFAFQNTPSRRVQPGVLQLQRQELDKGAVKYDLGLQLEERDGRVKGWLEYRSQLFDRTSVCRFLGQFQSLLQRVVSEPEQPVWGAPLLAGAESHQVVVEWNDTFRGGPHGPFLHQAFSARAAAQPAATAVVFEGRSLTYGELEGWSNRVARALRERGVKRETVVGIALERSLELVVAVLAVLKANGAYLPVDPSYPPDRIAFLLKDAAVPVLLSTASTAARLPDSKAQVVSLDGGEEAFSTFSGQPLEAATYGTDLAYTIYTSGSTGKPKGAMNSHRAILNRLLWMQQYFQLTAEDRVLQKTPFSFDVSVWEFLWPLMTGSTLVMARPEGHRDGAYLRHLIEREAVTTVHFVPSMLAAFLEEPALESLTSLRRIICSGEALPTGLARHCLARLPAPLFNLYGPTEAAVDVTAWRCAPESEDRPSEPIGRPISNTSMGMVDSDLRPVPLGVPGELLIGGVGLARGYRGRAALTAERFVPSPFIPGPFIPGPFIRDSLASPCSTDPTGSPAGERVYRTGDLARFRGDGAIEFLGRLDHQVKIHGLRIELGEIEAAMASHPGVTEAVAAAAPGASGMLLVGFVVLSSKGGGTEPAGPDEIPREVPQEIPEETSQEIERQLLRSLAKRLPAAMIPSSIVVLDEFPRLPNGKIDRHSLDLPKLDPKARHRYVAPRSPLEEAVAELGSQVLETEKLGVFDDFFALGGHSLTATRLLARVSASTGVEVPLSTFLDAPTVAALAAAVEQGSCLSTPEPVVPQQRPEHLPLSFSQRRLWILEQLNPGAVAYNVPAMVRLRGRLQTAALAAALAGVVKRHEALRTTFRLVGNEPEQVVQGVMEVSMPSVDLSLLAETERKAAAVASSLAGRPFHLEEGPLLRALLLRCGRRDHTLVLCLHHIVTDGWSMAVLVEELCDHYRAYLGDTATTPEPLAVQYPDFALWQRKTLQGERQQVLLDYWRERLTPLPPALDLPIDRAPPAIRREAGSTVRFAFGEDLRDSLKELARRERATLFMTLLAAFQAVLCRYSGQPEFAVGTAVANRHRGELEGLIGLFVNSLVMRAEVDGDPTFLQQLQRTRRGALDAYLHQDLPLEILVDEMAPRREASQSPLFQVMFVLQNAPAGEPRLPNLELQRLPLDNGTAKFDLTIQMEERRGGLWGWAEFSQQLFDPTTIQRLLASFQTATSAAVAAPQRRLSEWPLLRREEEHQLVVEWSGRNQPGARGQTTHGGTLAEVFAAQAEDRPSAVALVTAQGSLTYGELHRRCRQLAGYLFGLGVREEHRVPLLLDSTAEAVVALLAIARLGAAYVPMDPKYPADRLRFILEDLDRDGRSGPVLITVERYQERLPEWRSSVLCLDRDAAVVAAAQGSPESPGGGWDHLLYLMYTSGSTGRPKAVAVPQRGVLRLAHNPDFVRLTPQDVFLLGAPLSFDASTLEIWGALLNGARLVLPDVGIPALDSLQASISNGGVTVLWLTAGLFHLVVDQSPEILRGVRILFAGGDVLSVPHVRRLRKLFPELRLFNGYGPTENTTFTCVHEVGSELQEDRIPIGRPLPGTEVRLLDSELRPVPIGAVGELYTSGAGLARGYAGRPGRTAASFLPDPLSSGPGERLYRVGDLARWRRDGTVDFIGRADRQVKIRGFRIEPGEIETVLARSPDVRDVVVVAAAGQREKRLIAYIVPIRNDVEKEELGRFLGARLPDYMVPALWVFLESLPVTPSGKVDRAALPEPQEERSPSENREPLPELEQLLANIWERVLGVESVGGEDNFFELGGDSILAIQAVALASEQGVRFSPSDLFVAQSVQELARVAQLAPVASGEVGPVNGPVPLTPIQSWLFDRCLIRPHHFNQAVLLQAMEPLSVVAFDAALAALEDHHAALRLRFLCDREDGHERWRSEILPVEKVRQDGGQGLVRVDLSGLEGEVRCPAFESLTHQAHSSLDLHQGPVQRSVLFLLGSERPPRLLWVIHHLVVDGVSWRILLSDLLRSYRQVEAGTSIRLPPPTTSWKEWAERLLEEATSPMSAQEESFWRSQSVGRASLPVDFPEGDNRVGSEDSITAVLSREETERLLTQAHTAYQTQINDLLVAALLLAIYRWTGSSCLFVDLEGHGRQEEIFFGLDLSRTVGWFTALYPLVLEVKDPEQPSEVIKAVKERLRSVPRGGVGYGLLHFAEEASRMGKRRGPSGAQIAFNYLGQLDAVLPADSPLQPLPEGTPGSVAAGSPVADMEGRSHCLELIATVRDGQFRLRCIYSRNLHLRQTIEQVVQSFFRELRELVEHCLDPQAGAYTPADFPESRLDQENLDKLLARLGGGEGRGI